MGVGIEMCIKYLGFGFYSKPLKCRIRAHAYNTCKFKGNPTVCFIIV
jgi:hypothetical protein